jgi:hypothetical protein
MTTAVETVNVARLMSVADYAKDKEVTRQTVYNWIANGTVKSQKIGKSFFVVKA